jgi:hypothetical protein
VDLTGVEVIDPLEDEKLQDRYARGFHRLRQRKGITLQEASETGCGSNYFGYMMVAEGTPTARSPVSTPTIRTRSARRWRWWARTRPWATWPACTWSCSRTTSCSSPTPP